MAAHDDGPDSPWSMLGGAIGAVLAAGAAGGVLRDIAHAGWPAALALAGAGGAGTALAAGGSARTWFARTPRPLGGESTWATAWQLRRAGWLGGTGWPIGTIGALGGLVQLTVRIPDRAQTQSVYVLAPVGQGKTDSVIVPICRSEALLPRGLRHSLVVLDPKGDVLAKSRDALAATHDVLVFNPATPSRSTVGFDPLGWIPHRAADPHFQEECDNAAKIYLAATYAGDDPESATGRVSDPFWQKQPANILKGILLHLRALDPTLTWPDVADYLAEVTAEETVRHLTRFPRTRAARLRGATLREILHNDRARGGIIAELADRFVLLTDPRVRQVLGGGSLPGFDLNGFLARPTALFLQVGALGDVTLPILSVVLATLQMQLIRRTKDGGTLPRGVRLIIDEAGVIGRLYGLETGVAMMRSADVGYVLAVQATEQLRANYGQTGADIITRNLTHRLVLGGTADDDGSWVCRNLGNRNQYRPMANTSDKGGESTHYVREEWPLLRPDQLRRMRFRVAVDSSHIPPALLRLRRYTDGR